MKKIEGRTNLCAHKCPLLSSILSASAGVFFTFYNRVLIRDITEIYVMCYPVYLETEHVIRAFESISYVIYRGTATQYLHHIQACEGLCNP